MVVVPFYSSPLTPPTPPHYQLFLRPLLLALLDTSFPRVEVRFLTRSPRPSTAFYVPRPIEQWVKSWFTHGMVSSIIVLVPYTFSYGNGVFWGVSPF